MPFNNRYISLSYLYCNSSIRSFLWDLKIIPVLPIHIGQYGSQIGEFFNAVVIESAGCFCRDFRAFRQGFHNAAVHPAEADLETGAEKDAFLIGIPFVGHGGGYPAFADGAHQGSAFPLSHQ